MVFIWEDYWLPGKEMVKVITEQVSGVDLARISSAEYSFKVPSSSCCSTLDSSIVIVGQVEVPSEVSEIVVEDRTWINPL
ncbi:hypothetical protein GOBAR_AA39802 [Gossypium barbadense]|uniref:Uncharacterized protein n=1 Tax=Gossypium barbadense TaxID=3634 RepID=A0A2P5VQ58_GOSBA|nr:hypothetical protein GOBAR_AA39802 [Gossypium barbadense]